MACVDLSLSLIVQNMWQLKVSAPLYSLFSVSPNPQSEDVAEMASEKYLIRQLHFVAEVALRVGGVTKSVPNGTTRAVTEWAPRRVTNFEGSPNTSLYSMPMSLAFANNFIEEKFNSFWRVQRKWSYNERYIQSGKTGKIETCEQFWCLMIGISHQNLTTHRNITDVYTLRENLISAFVVFSYCFFQICKLQRWNWTQVYFSRTNIKHQTSPVLESESSLINPQLGVVDCGGEKNGGDDDHMGGFGWVFTETDWW